MTGEERLAWTQELLHSFEQSVNREHAHRIRLFREITRRRLGQVSPYATPEVAFRFLACGSLSFRMQCAVDPSHYSRMQPWQYCGLRSFCDSCACYERRRRAKEWEKLIRWVSGAAQQYPEQAVMLQWDLPDVKDARWLSRFSDYLNRVWQRELASNGIPPTSWMLVIAVNPLMGTIRGLYLGPSVAPVIRMGDRKPANAPVVRMEGMESFDAPVVPVRISLLATSGAWTPRLVRSIDFLDQNSVSFWSPLREALRWVADSDVKPSDLEPRTAIELDRIYFRRRVYSVHGLLHGVKGIVRSDLDMKLNQTQCKGFQYRCPACNSHLQMTCVNRASQLSLKAQLSAGCTMRLHPD